jgi:hypothetical protein
VERHCRRVDYYDNFVRLIAGSNREQS